MTANKPSDAIPEVMKRRIKELERDGYNKDFLRCFRNAIRSLDETDRYAHANKVQAEEIKALAARLAEADALIAKGLAVVHDFLPNIGRCVLQDYQRMNEFCSEAAARTAVSAVQPERCCLDYPRCDCNSPPEPAQEPKGCNHFPGQSTCKWCGVVQPGRCCLDYPRCDCNSPPEPDDDWLCFQRPTQPKVTP